MSLAFRGTTCVAPGQLDVDTASFSLKIERRFMRRVGRRVRARESGCAIHKKAVAPGPRCLGATAEEGPPGAHALNGNTSAAGSPPRSVRKRGDLANDDDLEPTLVLPRTAPGVLVPTSKLAWNVSPREAGSWRAPAPCRRSTSWRWASSQAPKCTDGTS